MIRRCERCQLDWDAEGSDRYCPACADDEDQCGGQSGADCKKCGHSFFQDECLWQERKTKTGETAYVALCPLCGCHVTLRTDDPSEFTYCSCPHCTARQEERRARLACRAPVRGAQPSALAPA